MLRVARRQAPGCRVANPTFVQADGQAHWLPAAALRHGARLCLVGWQPQTSNARLTMRALQARSADLAGLEARSAR